MHYVEPDSNAKIFCSCNISKRIGPILLCYFVCGKVKFIYTSCLLLHICTSNVMAGIL